MAIIDTEGDAKELIDGQEWHVWVLAYSISHGRRMELALHHGNFPSYKGVLCVGVTYFCGSLEGGPYRLRIEERSAEGEPIGILSDDGRFVVKCDKVSLGKIRYQIDQP